jgi:UDP-N-acetylmuramate dehydrogenase
MMTAQSLQPHLIDRLPQVRGRLTANAPLAQRTWFRVGGNAEVLFKPADRQDLIDFMRECPADVPITVIGVASNLLVRDGGIPGVTVRLGPNQNNADFVFIDCSVEGEISAGSAVLDATLAEIAASEDYSGLEFLSGIPGTIGGAVFMNAGCYGSEIADVLIDATLLLRDGSIQTWTRDSLQMTYRHSAVPKDAIVLDARFQVSPGDAAAIALRMVEIKTAREDAQPVRARTGGSTFANPDGHKAWQLIDAAGCRGLTIGGAQMSEKHCNFMINTGDATATDLETLGEDVRARVLAHSGIELRWEIQRVGVKI